MTPRDPMPESKKPDRETPDNEHQKENPKRPGTVYLVGFGPGDPDLLTVKAMRVLDRATHIFYDDLIDAGFLDKYACKKSYVGKRRGKHSYKQEEINRLLLQATDKSSHVVRLKGGDPFIFGRGGEELEYLRKHRVPVEIIPGVTASMAAAASAHIPLTMRGVSKYLTFLPAHNIETEPLNFPPEGTIAMYMGASKLKSLSKQWKASGRDPKMPAVLIQNASLPGEKMEVRPVRDLAATSLTSPLVIIIGEVVGYFAGNQGQTAPE